MTCLITGCVATNGHQWVGGDLHQIGEAFVFNAVYDPKGDRVREASWSERSDWAHYWMEVDFSLSHEFFERRAVLVAPMNYLMLNAAAREYLRA